ncbi:MAG: F0F1 ATP synthase subunit B [Candidatus Omnitrophica bacterium]|nr:F0F1 ATP synthase subunit B [Candidatus Omnitrophota bacterium]
MHLVWQEILTHALGFVILVWLLRRFAWQPLLGSLDARRGKIAGDLASVERAKQEIGRLQQEYQTRLAKIEDEARAKIQEAIRDGRQVAVEIQEQARREAQAVLDKTRESIALEIAQARVELRDRIAELAVEATEKLITERLDTAKDRAFILKTLDELERSR